MQFQAFPESLEEMIKAEAKRLGFPFFGICRPDPPEHYATYLRWLEIGQNGRMDYMSSPRSKECRADPHALLPGCQSIICLATPYPNMEHKRKTKQGNGRIAAFACIKDYHKIITKHLNSLVEFISRRSGKTIQAKICVDTSPILEKEYAQRAGLGWIGRNSLLYIPNHGSTFFLAEILVDLKLDTDLPNKLDGCGDCYRCVTACPTRAINPDRSINANYCLAYLSIEHKWPIPRELYRSFDDLILGCDICQEVCPKNRHVMIVPGIPELTHPIINPQPELMDELMLTPDLFQKRYQDTPVYRAKYLYYMRNVLIAMGNSPSSEYGEVLCHFFERFFTQGICELYTQEEKRMIYTLIGWVDDNSRW